MKRYTMPACPAQTDVWQKLKAEKRPLVVWGMGNGADKLTARLFEMGLSVADYTASDGFVRGQSFHGKTVLSFAAVKEKYPDFVLLLAFATSRPEVLEQLWQRAEQYTLLMPDLPVCGETWFDAAFYEAHYAELRRVYDMLSDETSRSLFAAVLQYKLTGDILILRDAFTAPEETAALLEPQKICSYADFGAYSGDTLRKLLELGAPLTDVLCVEPDGRTYRKLEKYISTLNSEGGALKRRLRAVQAAVWSENGVGCLAASGNRNTTLVGASHEARRETVPLVTPDSLCADMTPDYIKYDVEGAEEPALFGTALTIARAKPKVLLSVYHRSEDVFALPALFARLFPDYTLYLRRPLCVPAWELNLICLPRSTELSIK